MRNRLVRGVGASPGIVIARAIRYEGYFEKLEAESLKQKGGSEIKKFEEALEKTRREIELIREDFLSRTDDYHARIFDAQLLVLDDETLIEGTIKRMKKGEGAFDAFNFTVEHILHRFDKVKDEYIKARIGDIKDVANRVLQNLSGVRPRKPGQEKHAVIAEDLAPSDTAHFRKGVVVGFATDLGGSTSHTSIMAKTLGIPAVVGLGKVTREVETGDEVIIDGNHGVVIIEPEDRTRRTYEEKMRRFQEYEEELLSLEGLGCETLDGHSVELACNIQIPEEIEGALSRGAYGVGIMRTEFLYLRAEELPGEHEQYRIYNKLAEKVYPNSLIIRTLDLSRDELPRVGQEDRIKVRERNPFLGERGVRVSLARRDIFKNQLKAILRANYRGNVKIMFPMVEGLREVQEAKLCVKEAEDELKRRGVSYGGGIEIGVMIEIPSAALIARAIARELDFLSIGSNDLTQYTLACDRTNPTVAEFYNPLHPGVLKLIRDTIEASHSARKWVGLCGELGAFPPAIPILVGLGIDELSVVPVYLLEVKKIIRSISMEEAKAIAGEVSELDTEEEVREYIDGLKERLLVIKEVLEGRER